MDDVVSPRLNFNKMNARTKTLFHFTKSLEILQKILKEGFWPQYSLEDTAWIANNIPSRLAWPMVSFCDIPISRLDEHTDSYGYYGVGLSRKRWKSTGLNPVLYISPNSALRQFLAELISQTLTNPVPRTKTLGMYLLGHCKPLVGDVSNNLKDFYSECEWRYIPWVEGADGQNKYGFFLTESDFRDENKRREANAERRLDRMLEFVPADVRYLLVKTPDDAHKLVRFIESQMNHYDDFARDVLKTRILVWEDISSDL